ncbi:TonB-dependent receptor plug domain-containing protein [Colwellia sp. BRX10-3]|uniref:TonB-dependent receptor n=1 Tax=Colwellia sp. BRX10-3 TaxID=2759844 RepID=UPI0015F55ABE|nr:TonB-dependent receptor [Colwellia sp. BRX10-3]MBA6391966.1 TonB-dependent receptor plug domain-containing protein [Colwellia sp. BRX10-3]
MKYSLIALSIHFMFQAQIASAQEANKTDFEVIEVSGQRIINHGFSPKNTKISGPFGDDLGLADIARSMTPITSAMMEQLNITDLQDILAVTPSSYSATGFGAPSLPTLRGQLGELFQDGMRRQAGNNGFGVPLSFNAVDQLDVIKGAPPVLFGSSQRNGGFVNLQSKRASTQESAAKVKFTAGRWDQYSAELDISAPIVNGESGFRISAEHIDNGSFYDHSSFESDSLYAAFRLLPDEKSTWDINFEFYQVEFTDNAGINRPTQALIDHSLYITGQGVQPNGSLIPGAGAIISPTGQVQISRSTVLTDPDNANEAETFLLHSIYTRELSGQTRLKNSTYYQHLTRDEIAQNSFVEIIDAADTAQNRLEISHDWNSQQQTIFAFDVRYNKVRGYSQFTTEADDPIDLTGPIGSRRIPLTAAQQARLVELSPGVFVSPGGQYDINNDNVGDFSLSDTTDSTSWQTGFAIQQDSEWSDRLRTNFGYRIDFYDVEARDPIAPAGQIAARDSINEILHSGQASINYKLDTDLTIYAATSYNEATSNSMAGGNSLGGDNLISEQNFATENTLNEVGIKYIPDNSAWYLDGSIFNQRRSLRNRDGSNSGIKTKGVELQVFYDAAPYWFNISYSYLDARYDKSASFQSSSQIADAFDNSRPDIIQGTSVGAPNFTAFSPSTRRVQGIPEQSLSVNGGIYLNEYWQAGFAALYTSSYPLDFLATVNIRDQYTLGLNTSYTIAENTKVRFDINNVTNQKNWRPVFEGGYFGSTLVFPELPINAKLTLTHSF